MMSDSTIARTAVPVTPHGPDPTSALGLFSNGEFEISVAPHPVDGFRAQASGIARALGFRDAITMTRHVPAGEKGYVLERTPSGDVQVIYLTEAGFYRILGQRQAGRVKNVEIRSKVERFQSWVFGVVLPGLRRGDLIPAPRPALPGSYAEALRELASTVERADAAETKVAELEPRARMAETVMSADGDWSVRAAAQVLNRDPSISTGQKRLFTYLREIGWLDRRGVPYQVQIDNGRISTRVQVYEHPHTGEPTMGDPQVRITGKGLAELHKRLGGQRVIAIEGDL